MWILCSGMPRSGSTWQYLIASHITEEFLGGRRTGFAGWHLIDDAKRKASDGLWRTLKVHDKDAYWSALLTAGEALSIYSYRDLRDVVFSLMHIWNVSFDYMIRRNVIERLVDTDLFWREQPCTLSQRYEDLITDADAAIAQIASFMGVSLSDDDVTRLQCMYSLAANRERCSVIADEEIDTFTVLNWNHIRSGSIGGWKQQATAAQSELLLDLCREWLVRNSYTIE